MNNKFLALMLALGTLNLVGCLGGDSGSEGNDAKTGKLTLTGIEGVRYQTASQSGTTNSEGEFRYYEGETIDFWVGDLQIASDVPAKPFLTPIDFSRENRDLLYSATSDALGLTTHTLVEERLARIDPATINISRLLLTLDQDKVDRMGDDEDPRNNIKITPRTIAQLNQALASSEITVDFTTGITEFAAGAPNSPINGLIDQICFYPADDRRCDEPADQSEIDRLEAQISPLRAELDPLKVELKDIETAQNNGEAIDENRKKVVTDRIAELTSLLQEPTESLQKLQEKNRDIEETRRSVADKGLTAVETFLLQQTRRYNSIAARDYYITPFELDIPASDTTMKTLMVESYRGDPVLTAMDAITTNENAIMVPRWSAQTREVDFYATGVSSTEAEVRVSFRPEGDYRWFQFQLRPVIR